MENVGSPSSVDSPSSRLFHSVLKGASLSEACAPLLSSCDNPSFPPHGRRDSFSPRIWNDCPIPGKIGIHFPNVPGDQTRRVTEACVQPQRSEHVPEPKKVQANQPPESPLFSPERGFPYKTGLKSGIFPRADSAPASKIPVVRLPGQSLPVDMSAVRAGLGPSSFCPADQLGSLPTKRKRGPSDCLLGRLPGRSPRSCYFDGADRVSSSASVMSRLDCEFEKVPAGAFSIPGVSGHNLGHAKSQNVFTAKESGFVYEPGPASHSKSPLVSKDCPRINRDLELCGFCCASRTPPPQTDSIGQPKVKSFTPLSASIYPSTSSERDRVVGRKPESLILHPPSSKPSFHVYRCFGRSLGGGSDGNVLSRKLVSGTAALAHQQKGALCCSSSNFYQQCRPEKLYNCPADRQQNCGSVHSKAGGSEICNSPPRNRKTPQLDISLEHSYSTVLHSGETEHNSRQSVARIIPSGLAPKPFHNSSHIPAMGGSGDRFVCNKSVQSGGQVCVTRSSGSSGGVHRCVFKTLDVQPGLGISPPSPHATSPSSPEHSVGSVHNCCSSVAKSVLESRPQSKDNCSSVGPARTQGPPDRSILQPSSSSDSRADIGDLVNTGWGQQIQEWSESDRKLLTAAWRPSTRKSYRRPWSRWIEWTSSRNSDPHNPLPQHLAQFLAHLHYSEGLALKSILLHKSVVATFSNPDVSSSLSSHPVVTRMIKGIAAARPAHSPRVIWNTSDLLDSIRKHSPSPSSFFQVSRHLAILLLLASGRRIHDLTLLKIDSAHLQISADFVIFWPGFGSKTDSTSYQQSGWRLSASPMENHLWCIPHWLDIFLRLRNDRCRSLKLDPLFISTCGKVRPASRAIIAGWVATALSTAKIPFSPGSIRAAVNSSLARADIPLDDIMRRANWRSADTFLRHYYRPLSAGAGSSAESALNPASVGFSPVS
uniref:Tyr recombinase domain-containing protein n=2 Tax=Cacopsylla melanoneura TaxID=428564 RepID=A0A8D9ATD5_9HEMI